MNKIIDALHSFCEVPANVAHDLEKLILIQALRGDPKRDIFVACGVFAVRFELSYLSLFELADETRVFAPEQADVLDIEELHGPAFQSETECPAHLILYVFSCICHDTVMDDSRAKNF